jgi:hypothetical protein
MSFYTDVFKNIFVDASNGQNPRETELFKYISTKYSDYVEFSKSDFDNLSSLVQNSDFYFYIGGSDTDIDSSTAEKLVDAYLSGKSVFICGSEPFYNLSKSHPNHRIWSVFDFRITNETLIESGTKDFMLSVSSPVEMNGVSDFTFDILNETNPIRRIEVLTNNNLNLDKLLYVGQSDMNYVGFVKINPENNNRIIFVNVDLYGHKLNEEFPQFTNGFYYSLFFEFGTSVENDFTQSEQINLEDNLIIYPNPSKNEINFKFKELGDLTHSSQSYGQLLKYEICDMNGNIIKTVNAENHNLSPENTQKLNLKLDSLSKGVYSIIFTFDNKIIAKKIVKE